MKSLDQVEPRSPLGGNPAATLSINASGSYYLVSNVRQVSINANDVTLDLNGFSVVTTFDEDGIGISSSAPRSSVTIRNGSVSGPGRWTQGAAPNQGSYAGSTRNGILTYGRTAGNVTGQNVRIDQVTVRGYSQGISIGGFEEIDGGRDLVTGCMVRDFGTFGIRASDAVIRDTIVHSGSGDGIRADLSTLENCVVERATGSGLSGSNNTVRGFVARFVGAHGLYSPNSVISGAQTSGCAGAGVYADNSAITLSLAQNNGADGIRGVSSVISDCRALGNDTNTTDGYTAQGIVWNGGKIANSLADTASPPIP